MKFYRLFKVLLRTAMAIILVSWGIGTVKAYDSVVIRFEASFIEAGSVSIPVQELSFDDEVLAVTAIANDGYVFLGWYNGSDLASESATFTPEKISATYTANFTAEKAEEVFDEPVETVNREINDELVVDNIAADEPSDIEPVIDETENTVIEDLTEDKSDERDDVAVETQENNPDTVKDEPQPALNDVVTREAGEPDGEQGYNAFELALYNIDGTPIELMLKFYNGPDSSNLTLYNTMPGGIIAFPNTEDYRVMDIELDPSESLNTPFENEYYQPFRLRVKFSDDGKISLVENVNGEPHYNFDSNINVISIWPTVRNITVGNPVSINATFDNVSGYPKHTRYFSFVPEESGRYIFFSSENATEDGNISVFGDLRDYYGGQIATDSGSGENQNFKITYNLTAGTQYYIGAIRTGNEPNINGRYNVNVIKYVAPEIEPVESIKEGYIDITVIKEWKDNEVHKPVTVRISPANGSVNELVLSEDNGWTGVFKDLPAYDDNGEEIKYEVTEDAVAGYKVEYVLSDESNEVTYWIMIDAPKDLKAGRDYLLSAQDWGQAMYFNNPNTYYFMTGSEDDGILGMKRIENTNEIFVGPKTGDGSQPLVIGGKTFDEWLLPEHEVTHAIDDNQIWVLQGSEGNWALVNKGNNKFITLKGDNQWWNWWNPHVYSFINSIEDGWHNDTNTNYSHILEIEPANDGMAKISSTQTWKDHNGNDYYEKRYLYLNLTEWEQVPAATDNTDFAGQFKFFTPITKFEKKYIVINTPTEKISIPVVKEWVGNKTSEVTIKLIVGNEVVGEVKLNNDNGWKYIFEGLEKYDIDGKEIKYIIDEVRIDGYDTLISGNMQSGFVVRNTEKTTPKQPEPPKGDTPPEETVRYVVPKTGVNANSLLYGLIVVLALAALSAVTVLRKD